MAELLELSVPENIKLREIKKKKKQLSTCQLLD